VNLLSRERYSICLLAVWPVSVYRRVLDKIYWFLRQLRPVLLQDYFGTISGTISSTTNSTKIVLETSEKNGVFSGGFRYYFGTIICGTISLVCSRLVTNTRRALVCIFLQDARRSCRSCRPCRLSPLAPAAAIVDSFSTAAFS
jgi:hypothetical protein